MKKIRMMALLLAALLCFTGLVSCKEGEPTEEETADIYYTVIFNTSGGDEIEPRLVKGGTSLNEPETPCRDGFVFDGWYNGSSEWSFSSSVKENMTLTARWLSADNVFAHTPNSDGETTTITSIKKTARNIQLPTYIGGYKVTAIGDGVFSNLSSEDITKIVVHEGIVSIGEEAFSNSSFEIVIEGKITYIGENAFYGCTGLKAISLGEGLETVPYAAFEGSGISGIAIPRSVRVIDENAFYNCGALKAVVICESLEAISVKAFERTALKAVFFDGSDEALTALLDGSVADFNDEILDANKYIYSATEPVSGKETEYDGFWYYNEKGQTKVW